MKKSSAVLVGVIYVLLMILFCVVSLLLFAEHSGAFWYAFAFMCAGFLLHTIGAFGGYRLEMSRIKILKIPLIYHSAVLLLLQLVASLVATLFVTIKVKWVILAEIIFLLLYLLQISIGLIRHSFDAKKLRKAEAIIAEQGGKPQ